MSSVTGRGIEGRPARNLAEGRATVFDRVLGAIYEEELRQLRTAGRSLTEYYVLRILAREPDTTVTQLARRLSLAKSSVSVVVDDLVNEGLVTRGQHGGDRRRAVLRLSRTGKRWMTRFQALKATLLWEAMEGLTADEQRLVEHIIRRVAEALERHRASTGEQP